MIVEFTYSEYDIKKMCLGCKFVDMGKVAFGECKCKDNKIKYRTRYWNSKACKHKQTTESEVTNEM